MKYCRLIIVCLFVGVNIVAAHAQTNADRQLQNVSFIGDTYLWGTLYEISNNGTYLAENPVYLNVRVTNPPSQLIEIPHPTSISQWLNDTLIYTEYSRIGWDEQPPDCTNLNQVAIGIYDASTNTNQTYCLIAPAGFPSAEEYGQLERFPFNNSSVLLNNRYLIDIQKNTWQDWHNAMPATVSKSDVRGWIGYGTTWWDAQTRRPQARVDYETESGSGIMEVKNQTIRLCPMESDNCQSIINVQDYVHGSLGDLIISPDGQTILWSSFVYAQDQPVHGGVAIGIVKDVAAFTTDVETGTTRQIFLLSENHTLQAKGVGAQWSPDGKTLAIVMHSLDESSSPDNGLLLAYFETTSR